MGGTTFFFDWEVRLIEWIQNAMPFFCNKASQIFSFFGEQLLLVGIIGFLYLCYDKKLGRYVGTGILTAIIWNPLIKNAFLRSRPYMDHASIKCLRPVDSSADIYDISAQGYSFPSGHSSSALSAYGSIAAYSRKRLFIILAVILPLLVGISRFAVGVHYPTDVICGWLLGLFVVSATGLMQRKIKNPAITYLILALTGVPGWFYCRSTDFYTSYGLMIGVFAGFLFEARFVNFENTRSVGRCILRLGAGLGLYLALNAALKLPFSAEFLEAPTMAAFTVRAIRYAIVSFVCIGLYPMLFKHTAKIGKNNFRLLQALLKKR